MAAAYAYDWFLLGRDAAARNGEEALARLESGGRTPDRGLSRRPGAARGAAVAPELPAAAYRGRYCNAERGTMTIAGRGGALEVRMGMLSADAEPYTDVDTARVALIPNTGQVFQFARDGARITALRVDGSEFRRC